MRLRDAVLSLAVIAHVGPEGARLPGRPRVLVRPQPSLNAIVGLVPFIRRLRGRMVSRIGAVYALHDLHRLPRPPTVHSNSHRHPLHRRVRLD